MRVQLVTAAQVSLVGSLQNPIEQVVHLVASEQSSQPAIQSEQVFASFKKNLGSHFVQTLSSPHIAQLVIQASQVFWVLTKNPSIQDPGSQVVASVQVLQLAMQAAHLLSVPTKKPSLHLVQVVASVHSAQFASQAEQLLLSAPFQKPVIHAVQVAASEQVLQFWIAFPQTPHFA